LCEEVSEVFAGCLFAYVCLFTPPSPQPPIVDIEEFDVGLDILGSPGGVGSIEFGGEVGMDRRKRGKVGKGEDNSIRG